MRITDYLLLIILELLIGDKEPVLDCSRPVLGHLGILGAQEATIKDGVHVVLGGWLASLSFDG